MPALRLLLWLLVKENAVLLLLLLLLLLLELMGLLKLLNLLLLIHRNVAIRNTLQNTMSITPSLHILQ
jgi:hypothetical protein